MGKALLLFNMFILTTSLVSAQSVSRDEGFVVEAGSGIVYGNFYIDLIGDKKVPIFESLSWGNITNENFRFNADVRLGNKSKINGYSVGAAIHRSIVGPINGGIDLNYYDRSPQEELNFGRVRVVESDIKRMVLVSGGIGPGRFNENYFRISGLVAYGVSKKKVDIFSDGNFINSAIQDSYGRYLYRDESIMAGIGFSGRLSFRRFSIIGSAKYLKEVGEPTIILPEDSLFGEVRLFARIFRNVSIYSGGCYTNYPLNLLGPGNGTIGISMKF